jgi:hypothetical protein
MRPPAIMPPMYHRRPTPGNREILYFLLATLILLAMAGFILGGIAKAGFPPASMVGSPFNMKNDQIVGGVATSGTLFGGKESMVLTAGKMILNSMAEPPGTNPAATQPAEQAPGTVSAPQARNLRLWVEDFFQHNYRDITDRKTLAWGEPKTTVLGNLSVGYKFDAVIWNKDILTMNQVFTFTSQGEFVSVKDVEGFPVKSFSPSRPVVSSLRSKISNHRHPNRAGNCSSWS